MKLLLCCALLPLPMFAANCPAGPVKDGTALILLKQTWAKALEVQDAEAVGCILGEEFQDADPEGKPHNHAETLAQISHPRPLDPHVLGDSGFIRGLATLVDREGDVRARVRFTDIYVYRDQLWMPVAQETLLPEAAK
jgi:hypothetical protein